MSNKPQTPSIYRVKKRCFPSVLYWVEMEDESVAIYNSNNVPEHVIDFCMNSPFVEKISDSWKLFNSRKSL